MNNDETSGIGSFNNILGILFIGLKLCDVIDWSWWWVLSPLWIPFAIIFVGIIISLIFTGGSIACINFFEKLTGDKK